MWIAFCGRAKALAPVYLSIYLSIYLSTYLYIYIYIYFFIYTYLFFVSIYTYMCVRDTAGQDCFCQCSTRVTCLDGGPAPAADRAFGRWCAVWRVTRILILGPLKKGSPSRFLLYRALRALVPCIIGTRGVRVGLRYSLW